MVAGLAAHLDQGLEGVTARQARQAMARIESVIEEWSRGRKLYGHVYDDLLKLKHMHQRYANYLRWLEWSGAGA